MRLALVLLVYLAGTALSFRSTAFAAALFLWTDIFRPLTFSKVGQGLPVAWYVAFLLAGSFAWNWMRGQLRPNMGGFQVWFLLVVAWIGVTTAASPFRAVVVQEYIVLLKYLLPLVLIYMSLQDRKELVLVAGVLGASVGIWAAQTGLHCLIFGVNIDMGIAGGQQTDRNDFTAGIVGTLPIILFFAVHYGGPFRRWVRAGCYLGLFLSLSAIVFSLSRGASLGLAMTLTVFVLFISRKKIRDGALLLTVVAIGLALLPSEWWERMDTVELDVEQSEASAASRMLHWQGASQAALASPIFGYGPDGWLEVAPLYGCTANPHNIYLKLAADHGFPGLLIFLAMIGYTLFRVSRTVNLYRRMGDVRMGALGMALTTSIVGLLSAMTFLNRPFNEYLWAWIVLANAYTIIHAREAAQARRTARREAALAAAQAKADAEAEPGGQNPLPSTT